MRRRDAVARDAAGHAGQAGLAAARGARAGLLRRSDAGGARGIRTAHDAKVLVGLADGHGDSADLRAAGLGAVVLRGARRGGGGGAGILHALRVRRVGGRGVCEDARQACRVGDGGAAAAVGGAARGAARAGAVAAGARGGGAAARVAGAEGRADDARGHGGGGRVAGRRTARDAGATARGADVARRSRVDARQLRGQRVRGVKVAEEGDEVARGRGGAPERELVAAEGDGGVGVWTRGHGDAEGEVNGDA